MHTNTAKKLYRSAVVLGAGFLAGMPAARAAAEIFSWAQDAETQEEAGIGLKQVVTLRSGKENLPYEAWDFETEIAYGLTPDLELDAYIEQHDFDPAGSARHPGETDAYAFGGGGLGLKWRALRQEEDVPLSLALRARAGYSPKDEIDGSAQNMSHAGLDVIVQREFFDDRLVAVFDAGAGWATGKHPAENYENELLVTANVGASWKLGDGWAAGIEGSFLSEEAAHDRTHALYEEHHVFYAGPTLHYDAGNWWVTVGYMRQLGGHGEGEPGSFTYAKETDDQFRLKAGVNF